MLFLVRKEEQGKCLLNREHAKRNSKDKNIDKILKIPIETNEADPIKTGTRSDSGF